MVRMSQLTVRDNSEIKKVKMCKSQAQHKDMMGGGGGGRDKKR